MEKLRCLISLLVLMSVMAVVFPAVSAVYPIDISPLTVAPDEKVTVKLHDIPQDSIINMTLKGIVKTTPGAEMDFTLRNFTYPYYSGLAYYDVQIFNLTPGTPATIDVLHIEGIDASHTGNVSEEGRFNGTILHDLDQNQYNVSFIGIPAADQVITQIDFGGITNVNNGTTIETVNSSFIPSGITEGRVEFKVYIDDVFQKDATISVVS